MIRLPRPLSMLLQPVTRLSPIYLDDRRFRARTFARRFISRIRSSLLIEDEADLPPFAEISRCSSFETPRRFYVEGDVQRRAGGWLPSGAKGRAGLIRSITISKDYSDAETCSGFIRMTTARAATTDRR